MIYIAHRGNLNGPNPNDENKPDYIINAIRKGFYVETDLWIIYDELFLGHDCPQYKIDIEFLLNVKDFLFCHCKNIEALHFIIKNYPEIECFFHVNDECVLTSKQHIWNYPGSLLTNMSICVMPETSSQKVSTDCYAVCTDYPIRIQNTTLC